MGDLKNSKAIYFKGFLFLATGLLSAALLVIESGSWKNALLLALTIWCFCRFYYFTFYVIEHYVDKQYRFAGLWDFLMYLSKKNR